MHCRTYTYAAENNLDIFGLRGSDDMINISSEISFPRSAIDLYRENQSFGLVFGVTLRVHAP